MKQVFGVLHCFLFGALFVLASQVLDGFPARVRGQGVHESFKVVVFHAIGVSAEPHGHVVIPFELGLLVWRAQVEGARWYDPRHAGILVVVVAMAQGDRVLMVRVEGVP